MDRQLKQTGQIGRRARIYGDISRAPTVWEIIGSRITTESKVKLVFEALLGFAPKEQQDVGVVLRRGLVEVDFLPTDNKGGTVLEKIKPMLIVSALSPTDIIRLNEK